MKIAIHVERRKRHSLIYQIIDQNGFTMTRMTMPIINTVGISFIILQ
jgi:hypothetical protein